MQQPVFPLTASNFLTSGSPKTALQHKDTHCMVATTICVVTASPTNHIKESVDELRTRSNRAYRPILASLSPE